MVYGRNVNLFDVRAIAVFTLRICIIQFRAFHMYRSHWKRTTILRTRDLSSCVATAHVGLVRGLEQRDFPDGDV